MKVICAGLAKTGTTSLEVALRILGYNVHNANHHTAFYMDKYARAMEDKEMPDFGTMYADVDAVADSPACFFWHEIFDAFPTAKVVLSIRDDEEVWLKSTLHNDDVVAKTLRQPLYAMAFLFTPTGRKFAKIMNLLKNEYPNDNHGIKEYYLKHNSRVKAVIPRDNLLVFNVKQGWEPLCEFLGVDVPDVPFPRQNVNSKDTAGFINGMTVVKRMFIELFLETCRTYSVLRTDNVKHSSIDITVLNQQKSIFL